VQIKSNSLSIKKKKKKKKKIFFFFFFFLNFFFGGGIGTLNACLSFVIHMLAVNPHAQQKAFQEVIKICGYDVSKLN
jgi:hypothetical protein